MDQTISQLMRKRLFDGPSFSSFKDRQTDRTSKSNFFFLSMMSI
jgi:hypothetical protein